MECSLFGLALFCFRYVIPEAHWPERAAKISFWSLNLGLAWMVFATLLPLGILQLYRAVSAGYHNARSLKFIGDPENSLLEWLRFPLAAGYAVFLIIVASCLELASRHSHHRSERMRVAGFRYHADADLWTCPNNEKLFRADVDYQRGAVYYRAAAHACNRCPIESRGTDSEEGRVIKQRPDSWLDSEFGRFHRGLSLALVVLAALILLAELVRYSAQRDGILTAGTLFFVAVYGWRLALTMRIPRFLR